MAGGRRKAHRQIARYEAFIAAPMSALDSSAYSDKRALVLAVIDLLAKRYNFGEIYFAGAAISRPEAFSGGQKLSAAIWLLCRGPGCSF